MWPPYWKRNLYRFFYVFISLILYKPIIRSWIWFRIYHIWYPLTGIEVEKNTGTLDLVANGENLSCAFFWNGFVNNFIDAETGLIKAWVKPTFMDSVQLKYNPGIFSLFMSEIYTHQLYCWKQKVEQWSFTGPLEKECVKIGSRATLILLPFRFKSKQVKRMEV